MKKENRFPREFSHTSRNGSIQIFGDTWEYVAGNTFIAVRMSPKCASFSPIYSFVMNRGSDAIWECVRRAIIKRFYEGVNSGQTSISS